MRCQLPKVKNNLQTTLCRYPTVGGIWKLVWRTATKLTVDLPYDPPLPHLHICLNDLIIYSTDTCLAMYICTLYTTARKWNQSRHSLPDKWIMNYAIQVQWYLISLKKKKWYYEIGHKIILSRNNNHCSWLSTITIY